MAGKTWLYVPIEVESTHVDDPMIQNALIRLRNLLQTTLTTSTTVTLIVADEGERRTFLYNVNHGVRERKTRFDHAL